MTVYCSGKWIVNSFSHANAGACLEKEPLQVVLVIWMRETQGREAQKQRSEVDIWKICDCYHSKKTVVTVRRLCPSVIGWGTCYRNT